jgi:hypothetical protein
MPRKDQQLSAAAGEFLCVGKLFKLGLQATITIRNAKAVDILAFNPRNSKTYAIQVKSLRKPNAFPMRKEQIHPDFIYVFVILYTEVPNRTEEFYILTGKTILSDIPRFFGASYKRKIPSSIPGINYGSLKEYKDNWKLFDL